MPPEDANPVKNEDVDDDEECLGSMLKNRKKQNGAKAKKPEPKVKKEEINGDFETPSAKKSSNKVKKEECGEPTAKKSSNKVDKKTKNVKEEVKKSGAEKVQQNGKKRERKVYDLPGQKRDPPEERDPLRIFYESLYKQVPNSEMAAFWMMESGLLPKDEVKKVYEKKLKRNQQHKLGSPMKAVVNVKKSAESTTVKKKIVSSPAPKKKTPETKEASSKPSKKRKKDEDLSDNGSDDDFEASMRKPKKLREA